MTKTIDTKRLRGSLVAPVILIGSGLFFLLSNLGLITWDFWEAAGRLWPILLIAIGLDLLIGRRSPFGALLVLFVTIILLAGGLFWLGAATGGRGLVTNSVSQPLNGAGRAEVNINFGVGDLRLEALPAESPLLIAGDLLYDEADERIEQTFELRQGVAHYAITTLGRPVRFPFSGRSQQRAWHLALNRDTPLALHIQTGVGQANLDLRQLHVTDLTIESGVGQATVSLPGHGAVTGTIRGGVGELIIQIPEGVAARIDVQTGLGNSQVAGDYRQEGSVYTSPGYETAVDRINLELRAGIGQVTVRGYSGR